MRGGAVRTDGEGGAVQLFVVQQRQVLAHPVFRSFLGHVVPAVEATIVPVVRLAALPKSAHKGSHEDNRFSQRPFERGVAII